MPASAVGRRVAHAHLAFTLAVHRALTGGRLAAACWSPYSVASALGLAATGARGATRAELTALLLDGSESGDLAEQSALLGAAGALDSGGGRGDQPVLGVANTLWTREDAPIRAEFTAELQRWPHGRVRAAPFRSQPEAARRLINDAIAGTTHGLIPELLGPGSVTQETVATLVNALYLKVAWRNEFSAGQTERRPFHAPTGQVEVPTMRLPNKRLGYAAVGGWQVVVLPAAGDVEAVVLLPDETTTSGEVGAAAGGRALMTAEAALDADLLAELLDAPALTTLDLYLPKFAVRAKADLNSALTDLGVGTMFSDQADFSGISDERLSVTGVRHEAVLTVDEQGLEGAAATAVVMRALSLRRDFSEPLVVRVDRPFLFLVRHRPSGVVYFLARVTKP